MHQRTRLARGRVGVFPDARGVGRFVEVAFGGAHGDEEGVDAGVRYWFHGEGVGVAVVGGGDGGLVDAGGCCVAELDYVELGHLICW